MVRLGPNYTGLKPYMSNVELKCTEVYIILNIPEFDPFGVNANMTYYESKSVIPDLLLK